MQIHLQEVSDALKNINPILATSGPNNHQIVGMVEIILNSCIQLIGTIHDETKTNGVTFDSWCEQSKAFKDFMELYSEFCSHVARLCMKDMEFNFNDVLEEIMSI